MSLEASPALPLRALFGLTLAVLLAHLLALRAVPLALGLDHAPEAPTRAFITRTIEPAPNQSPSATPPTPPAVAARAKPARPQRQPQPSTATPMPTPRPPDAPAAPAEAPREAEPPPADPPLVPAQTTPTAEEAPAKAEQPQPAPRPPREALHAVKVQAVPMPVRLNYTVEANRFPFSLSSELLWAHDGTHCEARLEFSAFGQSRLQTSRGEITPEGLAPTRFSDKFRSEVAAHFDRQKGKVTFSANTPDAPLLAGAQDRLSILVQLAAMVASQPEAYPEATTIAIQTIGPREADTWLFTVGREETLTLPGGERTGLKLLRNPRKEFDQRVEVWLAPSMGYLPVRIRITEANGTYIDQKWLASHQAP